MTVRYVGPGGNDMNSGLSWTLRKLTLCGVEDTPVAAGDVVHVGPGVYRELLTVGVSGSVGSPITYIGDVTGEYTDGIGGIVRITGAAANEQSAPRAYCIEATSKHFRTFREFFCNITTYMIIHLSNCTDWIIEDCFIAETSNWGVD